MADATFASEGYPEMLLAWIEGGVWHLHLYTNDPPIGPATKAADFIEPAYVGYAPQLLRDWSPPVLRGGVAFSVHDLCPFVVQAGPAPSPIRGYYVTNGPAGSLAWARRRPGDPYELSAGGPPLVILLTLRFPPAPA